MENVDLEVDGKVYKCDISHNCSSDRWEIPRLVIVSYQPNEKVRDLVEVALKSLLFYTNEPAEIWVVDNFANNRCSQWLLEYEDRINLIFVNDSPRVDCPSYANALGIEVFLEYYKEIPFRFLGTFHQDVAFSKFGWLSGMLKFFSEEVVAVGTRVDTKRVESGALHPLGCIWDYSVIKSEGWRFWPSLPEFDFADLISKKIIDSGYKYYCFENTIWSKEVTEKLTLNKSKFAEVKVDRSVDSSGKVFFMHLGRGVVKSTTNVNNNTAAWISFLKENVLPFGFSRNKSLLKKVKREISYSIRRYYVDRFGFEYAKTIDRNFKILDIGGKKRNKRGEFSLDDFCDNVSYLNIDRNTDPDFLVDATNIPIEDNVFDSIITFETVEHLVKPEDMLAEAVRVLKVGGSMAITAPFLFHAHGDPGDYGRYTPQWYKDKLEKAGMDVIYIKNQGNFVHFCIYVLKVLLVAISERNVFKKKPILYRGMVLIHSLLVKALFRFEDTSLNDHRILSGFYIGVELLAVKRGMRS